MLPCPVSQTLSGPAAGTDFGPSSTGSYSRCQSAGPLFRGPGVFEREDCPSRPKPPFSLLQGLLEQTLQHSNDTYIEHVLVLVKS
jgi:hypothetical protein